MSRLTNLLTQVKNKDSQLGKDLEREFKVLASRRSFGLNFERHRPEAVELPQRPIRKGDKVRILPERGSTKKGDQRLWAVKSIRKHKKKNLATISLLSSDEPEAEEVSTDDLVVVAEFQDYIYPGLVSTGKVERGGDKPFHTVINGENYHALKALTYTHRGKIDAIYIDPPYNTGAKDWKYNNDYVEGEDLYRHSKWLAFMERRLVVAKQLLNPVDSVLIVTIDEKEVHRLGLLLEQLFPDGRAQMVSSVIKAGGVSRAGAFGRSNEYIYFVQFGDSSPKAVPLSPEWNPVRTKNKYSLRWKNLMRSGQGALRSDSPRLFYPIFATKSPQGPMFHSIGEPCIDEDRRKVKAPNGCSIIWPIRQNGQEGRWMVSHSLLRELISGGYAKLGNWKGDDTTAYYLAEGERRKVQDGTFKVVGKNSDGSVLVDDSEYVPRFVPTAQWNIASHDAGYGGARLLGQILSGRHFPFPKSLYAVEDTLRFFVANKPGAIILDFFSGSGTTAHAVMRLNRQDGGRRQCISITNNEVAAEEQKALREQSLRPGDPDWEQWGICDYITKPRAEAAITGKTPSGEPIKGNYRFSDEFPMAEGFEENAEFFTLTYESPLAIGHNLAFQKIAPLLWMRAGSQGRRVETVPEHGWGVVETYGLLTDLDKSTAFCEAVSRSSSVRVAYIVTNDDRRFQAVSRQLGGQVEAVRLYESYITNFKFTSGD